ncbi:MAG: serine/threonine-protein kinase, partial [Planctomycetota bacterium]|nr:serine/threonine-protein kinase [Planctomycetota bacterium]
MSTKRSADFLERTQRSGLVAAEKLTQSLDALATRDVDVDDPKAVADALVENETLTRWQADNLLQGKHKGFFVGSYRLLKPLGKGGMGTVYLAQHEMMRRRCAVKVLPQSQLHEGSSMLERFYVEAQAVAAMDHPNIVRAYDVNKESKDNKIVHYLVMEYVEGQDIESIVQNSGPLDFVTAADYLRQTANGLAHAHESGLVHRDIKPANLLIDRKGVVKILDLGLARFFDDGSQASLTAAHNETVLGTADYLSPEQALDSHNVDHRTDIYSLGCTGYCMLTGHPPFNEGSIAQRLVAHQIRTPDPITQERSDAPRDLVAIIDKMMAKNVEERHESANAVSTALAAWLLEHGGEDWRRQHAEIASDVLSSLKQREPTLAMSSPTSETELELAPLDDNLAPSSGSGIRDSKAGRQGLPDGKPGAEAGKSRVGLPQVGSKPGAEAGTSRVGLP